MNVQGTAPPISMAAIDPATGANANQAPLQLLERPFSGHNILNVTRGLPDSYYHYSMEEFIGSLPDNIGATTSLIDKNNSVFSRNLFQKYLIERPILEHKDHRNLCTILTIPVTHYSELNNEIWPLTKSFVLMLQRIPAMAPIFHAVTNNYIEIEDLFAGAKCIHVIEYMPNYPTTDLAHLIQKSFKYLTTKLKLVIQNIICLLPHFQCFPINGQITCSMPMFSHLNHNLEAALENVIRLLTMSIWLQIYTQPRIIWVPPLSYLGVTSMGPNTIQCVPETMIKCAMEYRTMESIFRDFSMCVLLPQHLENVHIFRTMLMTLKCPHLIPLKPNRLPPVSMFEPSASIITGYIHSVIDILMNLIKDNQKNYKVHRQQLANHNSHFAYIQQSQMGATARHIILKIFRKPESNFALNLAVGLYLDKTIHGASISKLPFQWGTLVVRQHEHFIEVAILPPIEENTDVNLVIGNLMYTQIPFEGDFNAGDDPLCLVFEIFMTRPQVLVNLRRSDTHQLLWSGIVINQVDPYKLKIDMNALADVNYNNSNQKSSIGYTKTFGDSGCVMFLTPLLSYDLYHSLLESEHTLNMAVMRSDAIANYFIHNICSVDVASAFHKNNIIAPLTTRQLETMVKCDAVPFNNGLSSLFYDIRMTCIMDTGTLARPSVRTQAMWDKHNISVKECCPKLLSQALELEYENLIAFDAENFDALNIKNTSVENISLLHNAMRLANKTGWITMNTNTLLTGGRLYVPFSDPKTPILTMLTRLVDIKTEDNMHLRYRINKGIGFIWTAFSETQVLQPGSTSDAVLGDTSMGATHDALYYYAIVVVDLESCEKRLIYISPKSYMLRYIPLVIEFDDIANSTNFNYDYSLNMGIREASVNDSCTFRVPYNFLKKIPTSDDEMPSDTMPFNTQLDLGMAFPFELQKNGDAIMLPFIWCPPKADLRIDVSIEGNLTNSQWAASRYDTLTRAFANTYVSTNANAKNNEMAGAADKNISSYK